MTALPPLQYLPHLRALTTAFTAEADADLGDQVPYCAGWTKADLVVHLGNVHRWAAEIVRTGELQPQEFDAAPPGDLARWYAESAAILLDALTEADPADRSWVFGAAAKAKAFWFRRQVHETAVHLIDAQPKARLDPVLAADGVDEVLGTMLPRVSRWRLTDPPLPEPIILRTTDTGHSWTVLPGEPPVLGEGPAVAAAATVAASAQDLLLLLWNRTDVELEIAGDQLLARAFLAARMTP
ncbi:maleylpyruvate isomerase family mycothiol-dependent enzyme [Amycolatopsis jejuensis]|uniref:maleylpyruvate isomerase family mycothiol-dependent enzyme n=1 Tax=Amycolatopsis jejuensis TaxID=330084 RepID=UPI000527712A|nr:maleylpyruvate isomerase family mycothiol-dependent enzyme [Amycolatopsis jejuensis]